MGFSNVTKTPALRAKAADLRVALREPTYVANPDQVFDNLDSDPQIADSVARAGRGSRAGLLRELGSGAGDPDTVSGYCRGHQREGRPDPKAKRLTLGHVDEVSAVAKVLHDPNSGRSLSEVLAEMRSALRIADRDRKLRAQQDAWGGQALRSYLQWSHHDARNPNAPFAGMGGSRDQVVTRLGLGAYNQPGKELVRWSFRLPPEVRAYTPTAWDADVGNPYWRSGGRTWPLRPGCGGGFAEVVHEPCSASTLVEPMEAI